MVTDLNTLTHINQIPLHSNTKSKDSLEMNLWDFWAVERGKMQHQQPTENPQERLPWSRDSTHKSEMQNSRAGNPIPPTGEVH